MRESDLLKKARAIREREYRLKPGLRLRSIDDMLDFVHKKGLVSVLGGNELPGLISAVLGRPWKPTGKGFTSWLDWWNVRVSGRTIPRWLSEMERRDDMLSSRIFRQTKTLVSHRLWPTLNPLIERHTKMVRNREILSDLESKILETIERDGPTRTDHLRRELRLEGKQHTSRFYRALMPLEGYGIIVGFEDPKPEKHLHANIWQTWAQRTGSETKRDAEASYHEALTQFLEETVNACVMARERDLTKWFRWEGMADAKNELVTSRRILRLGNYLIPARIVQANNHPKSK